MVPAWTWRDSAAPFGQCWDSARSGASKVETWQTYQEPGTQSLKAFESGEYGKALGLIAEEALVDGFVYDDIREKGRAVTRFRLVKLPLTDYLEWEFWNYRVREGLGEAVRIVDRTGDEGGLPSSSWFDFLLFDDSAALVHDCGTDGLQVGGWLVTSRYVLDRLGRTVADLREQSVALEGFIRAHDLRLAEWLG
jgi:hypothetical protein